MSCVTPGWGFNSFPAPFLSLSGASLTVWKFMFTKPWLTDRMWNRYSLVHSSIRLSRMDCVSALTGTELGAGDWRQVREGSLAPKRGKQTPSTADSTVYPPFLPGAYDSFHHVFQTFSILCFLLGHMHASRLPPSSHPAHPWHQALLPRSLSSLHLVVSFLPRNLLWFLTVHKMKSSSLAWHLLLGTEMSLPVCLPGLILSWWKKRAADHSLFNSRALDKLSSLSVFLHKDGANTPNLVGMVQGLEGRHVTCQAWFLVYGRHLIGVHFLHLQQDSVDFPYVTSDFSHHPPRLT